MPFLELQDRLQKAHEQLYNILNDPYEKRDLVTDNTDKAIELSSLLQYIRNLGYSRSIQTHANLPILPVNSNVKVYPNPFSDSVTFEVDGFEGEYDILINELTGKKVAGIYNCNDKKVHFNKGTLEKGLYLYQVITKNRIINSGKIMIE